MDKQKREDLRRLYEKLNAVEESNQKQKSEPKDVKLLNELKDQADLVRSMKPGTPDYMASYNQLLDLGYQYYHVSGQVDTQDLPTGIQASQLVEYYNRVHAKAFNLAVQKQLHKFLVNVSVILLQLENVPYVDATRQQFEQIRKGFQQQLSFLLQHGFALDLQVYQKRLEPAWLIIKAAYRLRADDFKPLVREMDRYTRLRTGQEKNVGYVPDKAHRKPNHKKHDKHEEVQERIRKEQEEKQRKRAKTHLSFQKDKDGNLIVTMPKGGSDSHKGLIQQKMQTKLG